MRKHLTLLAAASFAVLAFEIVVAQDASAVRRWYKGNLHTHTIQSDGDSTPVDVMAWYKRNGYQFLAITDHNAFTDPTPIDTNPNDGFLLIGAEEITNPLTVHVNAIGISHVIPPQNAKAVTDILAANLAAIRAQDAIPLICHPNYGWAFTAKDMLPLQGSFLLEIASGHPLVNHAGDGRTPSTEQMWDQLLSAGVRVFAAAVDDAHYFREEFTPERASPGRAWVTVRASSLTRERIIEALSSGDFYASTGVVVSDIQAGSDSLTVEIQASLFGGEALAAVRARAGTTGVSGAPNIEKRYRVVFIGRDGRELAAVSGTSATYKFVGNEGYVRARVEDSGGLRAWTQPVFVSAGR
jgi:hypothetical protein